MINEYNNEDKVMVAVDCIIFGFDQEALKLLLIKRDFEPEKGKWSLMGGFLKRHETVEEAVTRVLTTLTGLQRVYLEQLNVFSQVDRDPVERTISIAYYTLINIQTHNEKLVEQYSAQWFGVNELPELIFDHRLMVDQAIRQLQHKTAVQPIGFELLPKKFTMRQLQKLYESILNQKLDKRNFSKKINALDLLVKLDEKDKDSSRKGSYLYEFDQYKYQEKVSNGFSFRL